MNEKILYVVHCVDTEGPLDESVDATFKRLNSMFGVQILPTLENLRKIQRKEIDLGGIENAVAECFSPELLQYNKNWAEIDSMLNELLSEEFRNRLIDDFGEGWVYSWHCMDHLGFNENPRKKDFGYGNIFNFYKSKLSEFGPNRDEINWHFHPLSLTRNPTHSASSYINSIDILNTILCRRILEDSWFPVVNRPGFHTERPDSHWFLEQWLPFDYANQFTDNGENQPDLKRGRFGDWTRSSKTWRGYHPDHDDYQIEGSCRRTIFRCLNVGTRHRPLLPSHINEAFEEAERFGSSILAFADHDFRDMRPDVIKVQQMLAVSRTNYPDVKIKFAGSHEAAVRHLGYQDEELLKLEISILDKRLLVQVVAGQVFGPQPFLAIETKSGQYFTDNFDIIIPGKSWSYALDEQTMLESAIARIGVGAAGKYGSYAVERIIVNNS